VKYSDQLAEWLIELGYTHCFFVAGGNIMHLLESLSHRFDCRPVINEVAAGVAAEYFNQTSGGPRALALVTAGPGLTNIITAMAGAYLESRELLVIGGQVKTADLSHGKLRQRGIQEIDGVAIARPVSVCSRLIEAPLDRASFSELVMAGRVGRPGPVFLEIPLDVQAMHVDRADTASAVSAEYSKGELDLRKASPEVLSKVAALLRHAERPMILLGGGIRRSVALQLGESFAEAGLPVATTWNGADRIGADHPVYAGRPNTWGQRSANLILQQADAVLALGTRLGMQQTGFNWQQFVPGGSLIQVEIDPAELGKGHPRVDHPICAEANDFLQRLIREDLGEHAAWLAYTRKLRAELPLIESINRTAEGYLSPHRFIERLSALSSSEDIIVPCSSGGAFTVMMQVFAQKAGQHIVTNKGLASMGYGLSGAIGAAIANPHRRVVLVEGDGGFAQNLQEIGTAQANQLNLKIFLFDDGGYASIRMTQRNYFQGRYVGCDRVTGLGLPDWTRLFAAWDVPVMILQDQTALEGAFPEAFARPGLMAFIVKLDPEQTYFPKIASRVTASGAMESNPLHLMSPELDEATLREVGRFLPH
jgi:acetolactate synthase-1/2/3 large subunit